MRSSRSSDGTRARDHWLGIAVLFSIATFAMAARAQRIEWIRQFGTTADELGGGVVADPTGVYVWGSTPGSFPGQTGAGAYVRKYDANGTELLTRQFGAAATDGARGVAVGATGLYVVGVTDGALPGQTASGLGDAFVRKYDAAGNHLWTAQFGTAQPDFANGVAVDATGVYVVGYTGGILPAQSSAGSFDAFVRKYDGNGNMVWTRQFGTVAAELVFGVAVDATGVYVGGRTGGVLPGQTSAGSFDAFVRKYDGNGTELWTRQFGSAAFDETWRIAADATGVYVAGDSLGALPGQTSRGGNDAFVRKYDANGTELWTRQFGTFAGDLVFGVAVDATGVYVGGYTNGPLAGDVWPGPGSVDGFVRKYDTNGTQQWTHQFGSAAHDFVRGVAVDAAHVYVAGYTEGALPGQTSAGGNDAFLLKVIQPPAVSDGGVVNSASFALHPSPLAPGTIATIFGTSLTDGTVALTTSFGPNGRLVTSLGGTEVRISGVPAPMFFATPGQLAIQIPMEVAGQSTATVQVTAAGQMSAPRTMLVDSTSPGIFTANQRGTGAGVFTHENGAVVSQQNPARPDEVIVMYATGLGFLNPALGTGAPSLGNETVIPAAVTVAGVAAQVPFSGSTPGLVGLNQVNFRIPLGTRSAPDVPVVLSIGGKQSNSVTIAVSP